MKKTAFVAALLAIGLALTLSSCDAMFDTNLFKAAGLGQFDLAKADLSTSAGVQAAAADSPQAFYASLTADATAKDEALTTLVPGYDPVTGTVPASATLETDLAAGTTTPEDLALAAAIVLNTTDAQTVVENIAGQITVLLDSTGTPDVATVISNILPGLDTSQPTPPQSFVDMIAAFQTSADLLTAIANYASSTGTDLAALPGGTVQDTAFYGLASLAISAVQPVSGTVADALWAVISSPTPISDPSPYFTINTAVFDFSSTGTGSTAYTMLLAAGIDPAQFQPSTTTTP